MTQDYIACWLEDQIDESPEMFPPDCDFDLMVDGLYHSFDELVITYHLDDLLAKFLKS